MTWMSGWAGGWPRKEFVTTIGGVRVRQESYPELLNSNDPDVSFAYCFCGSLGTVEEADRTAARGKQKAEFSWAQVPETVVAEANVWASMLSPYEGATLEVQTSGASVRCGKATVKEGLSVEFLANEPGVKVALSEIDPDIGEIYIREEVPLGTDLQVWERQARARINEAIQLKQSIKALGVYFSEE